MKMRILLGKADGLPDRDHVALAPDSVKTVSHLPLLFEFDPKRTIGRSAVVVEGESIYADCDIDDDVAAHIGLDGSYPSLGLRVIRESTDGSNRVLHEIEPLCVSIGPQENSDQRVPPIKA